jgi:hypothetical protein
MTDPEKMGSGPAIKDDDRIGASAKGRIGVSDTAETLSYARGVFQKTNDLRR